MSTTTCTATTKNGSPCKRHALADTLFCKQHAPTVPPTPEDAPIVNETDTAHYTRIMLEPLTIGEAVESVMARFDCTALDALDRLVTHGAISLEDAAAASIVYQAATEKENQPMDDSTQRGLALIEAFENAPIVNESATEKENPTMTATESAPIVNQDAPVARDTSHAYQDATTPMAVVIPRKDAAKKPIVKRASRDQDVAYFDNVLRKRKDIRQYVMPEYFACPSYWTPTLKLKPGESLGERLERDYNAWLKSYAVALRNRKVTKINGVFFFPAKITPGAFIELIRAGKRAYCLEYAKNSKLFGDDPRATIATLIGIEIDFPTVSAVLETASAYHKAHGRKEPVQDDVDSAMDAFRTAFDKACKALRAIDTGVTEDEPDAAAQDAAGALVSKVTA